MEGGSSSVEYLCEVIVSQDHFEGGGGSSSVSRVLVRGACIAGSKPFCDWVSSYPNQCPMSGISKAVLCASLDTFREIKCCQN